MDSVYTREFYAPGRVIIREGSPGHELFIIESGSVVVYKMKNGQRKVIGHLDKGQVFGEMALIDASVRMATIEAAPEGTTLIKIPAAKFDEALNQCPVLIIKILKSLVGHLRRLQQ